jgi:hypothetical protein
MLPPPFHSFDGVDGHLDPKSFGHQFIDHGIGLILLDQLGQLPSIVLVNSSCRNEMTASGG